jgi:hypothetical protein
MTQTQWTTEEEQTLTELYTALTDTELQREYFPERSKASIRGKAQRMGLATKRETPKPRMTKETVDKIRGLEDADQILARIIDLQRETHKMSTNFDEVDIYLDVDSPICVAFTSDEHIGAHTTKYDALIQLIDTVQDTPYLYVVEVGDKIDNYLTGVIPQGMYEAIVPPEVQKRIAEHLFMKLKGRLIAMIQGCHDEFSHKADDFDVNKWICKELGVPNLGHEGYVNLYVGEQRYVIGARHRYKYNSSLNMTHTVKRFRSMKRDFDIGIIGHHHQGTFEHLLDQDGKDRVYMRSGSFKGADRYARQLGYSDQLPVVPCVVLFPDRRRILPFLWFEDAVEYMNALYP